MDKALSCLQARIDDQTNVVLMRPVTKEEIQEAVFNLGVDKAPSPMAFQVNFYHSIRTEIGDSIRFMILEFFYG